MKANANKESQEGNINKEMQCNGKKAVSIHIVSPLGNQHTCTDSMQYIMYLFMYKDILSSTGT